MGCPRIAQQIARAFDMINKDVVRRICGARHEPETGGGGPSWLTFLGHVKDSLWSIDFFRCESGDAADTLGITGHVSMHTAHCRIRHPPGQRRWNSATRNVQSSNSRPAGSEIAEFRS